MFEVNWTAVFLFFVILLSGLEYHKRVQKRQREHEKMLRNLAKYWKDS